MGIYLADIRYLCSRYAEQGMVDVDKLLSHNAHIVILIHEIVNLQYAARIGIFNWYYAKSNFSRFNCRKNLVKALIAHRLRLSVEIQVPCHIRIRAGKAGYSGLPGHDMLSTRFRLFPDKTALMRPAEAHQQFVDPVNITGKRLISKHLFTLFQQFRFPLPVEYRQSFLYFTFRNLFRNSYSFLKRPYNFRIHCIDLPA